ncbi:RNA polymerase factor sigma-54 [Pusillimonas sp. ANT_WB101]|uniref:RNA polymerase factor sigma-54 n=1 Tax=Pusillimonas sp. ANT_WB101 TaxID=2597356 RepID=UPI0011ECF376|nr:RNA polymerase factor sigma-54 [Pusillimonas sp. ANT_WB101]KAA0890746.1 RNA polymerase factor sigma-54 [Pusillimonas sp. ANT_WB101]
MAQISHELQARQQTSLTPRLQQSVKLLQMSTLDFNREVLQALASNPFLEEPDEEATASASEDVSVDDSATSAEFDSAHDTNGRDNAENLGSSDQPEIQQIEASTDGPTEYSGDYPSTSRQSHDGAGSDVGEWARSETSLQEALLADLTGRALSERDHLLALYIIEAIDDDGYLRVPFEELAAPSQFQPPVQSHEWECALSLVQHLTTPGIAARSLTECLTLQLEAMPDDTAGRDAALRIVDGELERLGRCDYAGLARFAGCTEDEAREAGMLIRQLSPRPGQKHTAIDPSTYIIPDVIVRKVGRLWVATNNREAAPQARLNHAYAQMFRKTRYDERALMAQALQEARWLMRSLEQRSQTIQRVAQAIVARQQTFFDYGEIALRPLMLSEIAEELGMHESTVSRATSHKYLASPRGVFEFKHFFSRELSTRSGGTCSAGAVRALIQEMIDAENPKEPLSDVTLASQLAREGIVVARRTVSKYRAQIKYPPAELRRAP